VTIPNKAKVWTISLVLALLSSSAHSTEVYKWVDENGVVHFSDQPVKSAKKVVVDVVAPTITASPAQSGTMLPNGAPLPPPPPIPPPPGSAADVQYTALKIWSPNMGQTYYGESAQVDVRIRPEPEIGPKDRLLLYLDGKLVETGSNALTHSLKIAEHGVHSLTSVILDAKGTEKIRSEPVVFHLKTKPTSQTPSLEVDDE
jgi:hypothetical protein